jgi:Ca2+-binding EF-hand superfamily protein
MQRKQLEENRKKLEEANKKRIEEQRATLNIRRMVQQLKGCKPEGFEDAKKQLEEVMQKDLANCGSQMAKMQEECTAGITAAQQRIEQVKAAQKAEEERKAELEKKRKEAQELAEKLLGELTTLVDTAEEASKKLLEEAEPFKEEKEFTLKEVEAVGKAVEEAGKEAKDKMKICTDFILNKGPEMKPGVQAETKPGENGSEVRPTLQKILSRISEHTRATDKALKEAETKKAALVKKAEAKKKLVAITKNFDKYDKDKDGHYSKAEVKAYAKGEFKFDVPALTTEQIWKVLVADGGKGVKKADFQRLKAMIGVAREKVKDDARRKAREEKEAEIAKMKEELTGKVKEVSTEVTATEEKVKAAEAQALPLPSKAATMGSAAMITLADETEALITEAKEKIAETRKSLAAVSEDVDADLKVWLAGQVKPEEFKLSKFEPRLTRSSNMVTNFREKGKKKAADELAACEKTVKSIIKHHQTVKKLKNEEVFEAFGGKPISDKAFIKFFSTAERPPVKKEAKKEDAKKEDGDAKDEEELVEVPSSEDLKRVFAVLDENEEGSLSKEIFLNLIRVFMKVAKDTVISDGMSVKDSKTIRRLEVGEVVEVLEGPMKEDSAELMRIHAKVMKDDTDGWITIAGNQGTLFLEEGGNIFKVVKETIMTDCFELDGTPPEGAKKLKDTKLKEGELMEVREWAKKEEKSGLMRMKAKAKSDGRVGWVTTLGNQGTVFLEVV